MGFKPPTKHYEIVVEDYPGLEVTARSAPLGEMMDASALSTDIFKAKTEAEKLAVFEFFVDKLITWNIDHPDTKNGEPCKRCGLTPDMPLPTTVDGMLCLDMDFVMKIIFGWMGAVTRLSVPKGMSMPSGANGPEDLMMKLAQLANLSESPEPN